MNERGLLYPLPSHNEHVYLKNRTSNVLCSLQVAPGHFFSLQIIPRWAVKLRIQRDLIKLKNKGLKS